jgi:hypothetical protein
MATLPKGGRGLRGWFNVGPKHCTDLSVRGFYAKGVIAIQNIMLRCGGGGFIQSINSAG